MGEGRAKSDRPEEPGGPVRDHPRAKPGSGLRPVPRPARRSSRSGRPSAGGDWTERLALRNWSLPVKLTAVLLVPTLFVLTLGVLRIMEQTRDAAEFDGVQQAVALEDGTARVMGSLADERSAAAVYVAAGRAGGSGPVEERIGATRDATSELRRSSGLADSLDEQTRTSFDQADAELDQLDRLRDDVIDGRVDAAGAIARYTEVVDTLEIFDRSLSREAADPSVAGLASGLYSLSVVREEDAYVQAVVAAGIAAGRIDAPSIDQARNATLRRSIAVDDFRSAVGTDNAGLADAVVGPDVDNRDLLAQVVLGRGAAGLPLQVSGPDWERASVGRRGPGRRDLRAAARPAPGAGRRAAAGGPQRRGRRLGDPAAGPDGRRRGGLLRHPLAAAPAAPAAPQRARRRRAAPAPGRPQPARGRGAGHHDRPDADHDARGDRPGRPRVRPGARAGGPPGRRAGGSAVGVQLDLREPVAALPGARRAPAAPHRAAGELRGGPGGALQPLPARPPRDAHAPQLGEPAGALGHRPLAAGQPPGAAGRRAARRAPPRWSSTSASTSRRRPRPSCWAARRATSCTSSPSCSRTPPRSPPPTPACGCRRRRTATAPCSSRSSTPVSA